MLPRTDYDTFPSNKKYPEEERDETKMVTRNECKHKKRQLQIKNFDTLSMSILMSSIK